jgi:DnaK suppressor protein
MSGSAAHACTAGDPGAERSALLTLMRKLRLQLIEVDDALARMDAGTYGRCQKCGQPIPEERFEALPATRQWPSCNRQQRQLRSRSTPD